MRKIILLVFTILFLTGCFGKQSEISEVEETLPPVIENVINNDSIINSLNSEIIILKDSINVLNSTTKYEDYINGRRIEKIKYYISITEKRPDNKKYFFGWIKRTISED